MSALQIHPGEICLIMATRGRPEMLAEVFTALKTHTAQKNKVSLWLYVDEDDFVTRQAIDTERLSDAGVQLHWHIGGQTSGLGEMQSILWQASGRTAEIYMVLGDDVRFDTPGWVHQIGEMAGRYARLPIIVLPVRGKGKTRRMRDLPFWARFFQLALDERKISARKLIDAMNLDSEKKDAALKNLEQRAAGLEKQQDKFSDLYAVFQEERFTLHTPEERRAFNPAYFEKEAAAVAQLLKYAQQHIADKKYDEALKFLDGTLMSNLRVRQAQDMKVQCLRTLGRNSEADKLAKETLAAWPEMNFFRRIFRFLGMVASDGKAMIVGFLSKGGDKKVK